MHIISKFNPYIMTDDLISTLSTGREKELTYLRDIIGRNILADNNLQHILFIGPRGIGKSYLLRLMQIELKVKQNVKCFLLPEEQNNCFQPADLIREIRYFLLPDNQTNRIVGYESGGKDEWERQVKKLSTLHETLNNLHIVIGIENFDMLLKDGGAFSESKYQTLLREFLMSTPWLTMVATTLYPNLAIRYEKALFLIFQKHELKPWNNTEHQAYLDKKFQLDKLRPNIPTRAQLKTLTRFTGGIPRITVIMADILTQGKLESVTHTLETTIDFLTPFYQDLLERIPVKSRLLFDALIRGGEPCTQEDLAKRVRTKTNVISRDFNRLVDQQYIVAEISSGEKQKLYSVRDRLFAHYYRMRYIHVHSGKSILVIMSEFLTTFYSGRELRKHAEEFYGRGQLEKSRDLLQITLKDSGVDAEELPWKDDIRNLFNALDLKELGDVDIPDDLQKARSRMATMRDMLVACTYGPRKFDKIEFSRLLFGSLSFSLEEKLKIVVCCLDDKLNKTQWEKFLNLLRLEKKENFVVQGHTFELLKKAMIEGEVIFEFLKNADLDLLQIKNPRLYIEVIEGRGLNSNKLGRYQEALKFHATALRFRSNEKNLPWRAWNLVQMGLNLEKLGKLQKALKFQKRALKILTQIENFSGHGFIVGRIAFNLEQLGRFEEAIASYKKAFIFKKREGNIIGVAWTLGRMGWVSMKLKKNLQAIKLHKSAAGILKKCGKPYELAWNFGQIGWNSKKLGLYKDAVKFHNRAHLLGIEHEDIVVQAGNLGELGWNSMKLGFFTKAIQFHLRATKIYRQIENNLLNAGKSEKIDWNLMRLGRPEDAGEIALNLGKNSRYDDALENREEVSNLCIQWETISGQAWNLGQIGWNSEQLKIYDDASEKYYESIKFWQRIKNRSEEAWCLGRIGSILLKLKRYEEAINSHNNAIELWEKEKNRLEQAWNLGKVGFNLTALQRYTKAYENHKKAFNLSSQGEDSSWKAFYLGKMAGTLIIQGKNTKAWDVVHKFSNNAEEIHHVVIKNMGFVIRFFENDNKSGKAYAAGIDIIDQINERKNIFDPFQSINALIIGLLEEGVSILLVEDLLEYAIKSHGENMKIQLFAIKDVIYLLKSNKSRETSVKMSPERRKAAEALIEELNL